MSSERMKILEMIQDGKLTAAEGMELLKAIDDESPAKSSAGSEFEQMRREARDAVTSTVPGDRFLRVRVLGEKSLKVNVNVPLSLLRSASKLVVYALSFVPDEKRRELEQKGLDLQALNIEDLVRVVGETVDGKIVDVEVEDPKEGRIKVEVCVE